MADLRTPASVKRAMEEPYNGADCYILRSLGIDPGVGAGQTGQGVDVKALPRGNSNAEEGLKNELELAGQHLPIDIGEHGSSRWISEEELKERLGTRFKRGHDFVHGAGEDTDQTSDPEGDD